MKKSPTKGLKHFEELTQTNVDKCRVGEYFTYGVSYRVSYGVSRFYRKGLKISNILMIPVGGASDTLSGARDIF